MKEQEPDQLDYFNALAKKMGSSGYTEDDLARMRKEIQAMKFTPGSPRAVMVPSPPLISPSKTMKIIHVGKPDE